MHQYNDICSGFRFLRIKMKIDSWSETKWKNKHSHDNCKKEIFRTEGITLSIWDSTVRVVLVTGTMKWYVCIDTRHTIIMNDMIETKIERGEEDLTQTTDRCLHLKSIDCLSIHIVLFDSWGHDEVKTGTGSYLSCKIQQTMNCFQYPQYSCVNSVVCVVFSKVRTKSLFGNRIRMLV